MQIFIFTAARHTPRSSSGMIRRHWRLYRQDVGHRLPGLRIHMPSPPLAEGEAVLDIGCGAGTDLLLAARRIGPTGRAIGIDMTDAMRNRALSSAAAAGLTNVEVYLSDATSLPIQDASVDVHL
jgi:ubiquinone/menaquinone biosynthesis C-methylase UbiE